MCSFQVCLRLSHWLFVAVSFLSLEAFANCTLPVSIGANDALILMLPGGGETAGYIGKGARTESVPGTFIFDSADNRLKICVGTSWLSLSGTPNVSAPRSIDFKGDVSWGKDWRSGKGGLVPTDGLTNSWWSTTKWSSVSMGEHTGGGGAHACGIRASDSRLFCWGANADGKLGDGTTTDRSRPTALTSAGGWDTTAWSSVSAGWGMGRPLIVQCPRLYHR